MISENLLQELKSFIDQHLSIETVYFSDMRSSCLLECMAPRAVYEYDEFDRFIEENKKPAFNKLLLELIDQKGLTDAEVYKRACLDRRLFSKIRLNENYRPGKNTIIALALALELDRDTAEMLLSAAGYTLSESETFDLIIRFCIEKKIFNIADVNLALDYFSQKPLTGVEL